MPTNRLTKPGDRLYGRCPSEHGQLGEGRSRCSAEPLALLEPNSGTKVQARSLGGRGGVPATARKRVFPQTHFLPSLPLVLEPGMTQGSHSFANLSEGRDGRGPRASLRPPGPPPQLPGICWVKHNRFRESGKRESSAYPCREAEIGDPSRPRRPRALPAAPGGFSAAQPGPPTARRAERGCCDVTGGVAWGNVPRGRGSAGPVPATQPPVRE